ncbi:MAG: SLBB domain-containing protein [Saprospiraceae bacterium]|uniref:SLBB domain-containing protein n=1 Tax=Candidatus Opimibacter skivensis TaxID=2982028 RepID=A0A9D7SV53_9BACT|nr:SLBB domain-containing protein [Candidatus Opimibacter skivensis]
MHCTRLKHISCFFLFLLLIAFYRPVSAQITPAQASELLAERGVNEDTLRARLIKKGYDPDQIQPDQIAEFQGVIVQTIKEIEADQQNSKASVPIKTLNPDVNPAKKDIVVVEKPEVPPPPPAPVEVKKTPIYGQEIFRNNSVAVYQKADEVPPSDDYILGVGDKIGIVGFGRSAFDEILEIGPDGFVKPSKDLPRIILKGLKFGEAKELLFQRYKQYYLIDRGEFQVTLNKPRNISINVLGEAKTTGTFTLPAFNTAFNVLSAAGGPTDIGSVRRIKVISGSNVRVLDVYEFMNDPGVAKNFFLQNNDFIHVPVAEKVVEIDGAITRPMAYELLDKENLSQLIKYAGGVKANGYLSDVKVTRYLDDKQVITNVNFRELAASGGDYVLYNGDKVEIKTIENIALNFVDISGAVYFQGKYERRPGMRIADLLNQSKLRPEARLDFGFLLKFQQDSTYKYQRVNLKTIVDNPSSSENIELSNGDKLQVMALKSYIDPSSFSIVGAVRNPDTFAITTDGNLKLEDAILLAGGLLIDAEDHGYIIRQNPSEPKRAEYIQVNIREAFNSPDSDANVQIKAGDQIRVFGKGDLRDILTVSVFGAVRIPGTYPYGPEMNLADLVNLAGGFTFGSDHDRIDISRSEYGDGKEVKITQYTTKLPSDFGLKDTGDTSFKLEPFDNVYIRNIPQFEPQSTVYIKGEVRYPGTYPILRDKERISDLIERAGGLSGQAFPGGAKLYRQGDSTGLVVINLQEILQNKNIPSNVILLNSDILEIPKTRDLVTIGGLVNLNEAYSEGFLTGEKRISVAFRGEKNAKYYINHFAAGVNKKGSTKEIKVQYADGGVERTTQFLFFTHYPKVKRGSFITVGPKEIPLPTDKNEKHVDWETVFKDTLTQATAVLTLIILVDQLGK